MFLFQFPVNKLTDLLRQEVACAGFTEVLTFALVSLDKKDRGGTKVLTLALVSFS